MATALHARDCKGSNGRSRTLGSGESPHCQRAKPHPQRVKRQTVPGEGTSPLPSPGARLHRVAAGWAPPRGSGPASGQPRAAPDAPEASRTHLHEAVCVREARQHHLPVRLDRARGRLGLGLSGTGRRHFPAGAALLASASASARRARTAHVRRQSCWERAGKSGRNQPGEPGTSGAPTSPPPREAEFLFL